MKERIQQKIFEFAWLLGCVLFIFGMTGFPLLLFAFIITRLS